MTETRIRDALLDERAAVAVPAPDEVDLRGRVHAARRRRAGLRALAAACVVVLAGSGFLLARPLGANPHGPAGGPPTGPGRGPSDRTAGAASAPRTFPISLEGRLQTVLPDGSSYATGTRVEEVLGSGPAGVVVVGTDSHLLLVRLMRTGQPEAPIDLADGRPVQRAALDKAGATVAFVDLEGRVHLRAVGSSTDLGAPVSLPPSARLLAVDGDQWLSEDGITVTVHAPDGRIGLRPDRPVSDGELAGNTVAAEGPLGVTFFDASTGARLSSADRLVLGSLSPDGREYIGARRSELDAAGDSLDWYVVDTRTGATTLFGGRPDRARATAITWQDSDRFLVAATDVRQRGNRIVWDCSMALGACEQRYNDPGHTLVVATR